MKHFWTSLCLIVVTAAAARAEPAMVQAARLSALQRLSDDIADEMVVPGVSVSQVVDRMNGQDLFTAAVSAARQVGGPRWVDDSTCQVRMDLPADRVVDVLETLQQSNPNRSPVSFDDLVFKRKVWRQKVFSATGTSITFDRAMALNPPSSWRGVTTDARRAALESARRDAARRGIDAAATCVSRDAPAVLAALSNESVRADLERWAAERPITSVRYRDDQNVEVSLAIAPDDLAGALRGVGGEIDPAEWERAARRLAGLPRIVTGRASVGAAPPRVFAMSAPAVVIPSAAPDWAGQQLTAEATAEPQQTALKTARTAEALATGKLRERIEMLSWNDRTLGSAAREQPALADAIDTAIATARVSSVDYLADGAVRVRIMLSGQQLWKLLRGAGNSGE